MELASTLNVPWPVFAAAVSATLGFGYKIWSEWQGFRKNRKSALSGILAEVRVTEQELCLLLRDFKNLYTIAEKPAYPTMLIIADETNFIGRLEVEKLHLEPETVACVVQYQRRFAEYNSCAATINSQPFEKAETGVRVRQVEYLEQLVKELQDVCENLDTLVCAELREMKEFSLQRKMEVPEIKLFKSSTDQPKN